MRNKLILLAFSIVFCSATWAQDNGTAVLPFNEGKVLTNDDVSFLQLVSNQGGKEDSRGKRGEATIGKTTYKSGAKLSKADVVAIQAKIDEYDKNNKDLISVGDDAGPGERGAAYCGYYCYYWVWHVGYQRYVKYWYYCCL